MTTIGLEFLKLQETKRSNLSNEDIKRTTNAETARHNVVVEGQEQQRIVEANRHNLATEKETKRSNMAKEEETRRTNVAKETENKRSNLAKELETKRANMVKESTNIANSYSGYAKFDMLNQLSGNTNNVMGFLAPVDSFLYNTVGNLAGTAAKLLLS